MGLFSDIKDTLFGGVDDSAQKGQARQNKRAQEFIERQAQMARRDAFRLQPYADEARNLGYQSALDVLTGSLPERADVFQRGNVAAQDQLIAGMPQIQNALMGVPVDYSAFQSVGLSPDLSSLTDVTLPEYRTPSMLAGDPTQTTNQELVANAYDNGLISEEDYMWHLANFRNTPNLATAHSWGMNDNRMDSLNGSPLTPTNRARMERLFLTMFPGGTA